MIIPISTYSSHKYVYIHWLVYLGLGKSIENQRDFFKNGSIRFYISKHKDTKLWLLSNFLFSWLARNQLVNLYILTQTLPHHQPHFNQKILLKHLQLIRLEKEKFQKEVEFEETIRVRIKILSKFLLCLLCPSNWRQLFVIHFHFKYSLRLLKWHLYPWRL